MLKRFYWLVLVYVLNSAVVIYGDSNVAALLKSNPPVCKSIIEVDDTIDNNRNINDLMQVQTKQHSLLSLGTVKSVAKTVGLEIVPVAVGCISFFKGLEIICYLQGENSYSQEIPVILKYGLHLFPIFGYEGIKWIQSRFIVKNHNTRKSVLGMMLSGVSLCKVFEFFSDLPLTSSQRRVLIIPSYLAAYHGTHTLQDWALEKMQKKSGKEKISDGTVARKN